MDRQQLLTAIADARPGPADVVYVERRGEEYSCRVTSPGEDLLLGGGQADPVLQAVEGVRRGDAVIDQQQPRNVPLGEAGALLRLVGPPHQHHVHDRKR